MSYLTKVSQKLLDVESSQAHKFELVSENLFRIIEAGGVIHTFGCGHSSLLAQDIYYRAGGLVPVQPIWIEELMLHRGARQASENERQSGVVQKYLESEDLQKKDAVLIISTSGRNPAPIETAIYCKEKGLYTVGLTSLAYKGSQHSRHSSDQRLEDIVDDVIDMEVPVGDAIMQKGNRSYSPVSSVVGAGILHELMTRTIERIERGGETPPVFKSGNVDGSDQHNLNMMQAYKRITF
ncbi:sugar isomerase domain-containing protein [Halobacillus litoralis]|uniref:Sugar isomerase domain-containing protein n=1 Tax=Halobacillus litoralis TaxID=45668 RepID=A0A845E8A1_9BACI|nr:SIS domain-containing protein [Halobacillus litoralis]MYL51212.1 sugar isomerase domain-containing protein [Halobacillus litoralis]